MPAAWWCGCAPTNIQHAVISAFIHRILFSSFLGKVRSVHGLSTVWMLAYEMLAAVEHAWRNVRYFENTKKKRKMYDNRAIEEWVKGEIEVAEK